MSGALVPSAEINKSSLPQGDISLSPDVMGSHMSDKPLHTTAEKVERFQLELSKRGLIQKETNSFGEQVFTLHVAGLEKSTTKTMTFSSMEEMNDFIRREYVEHKEGAESQANTYISDLSDSRFCVVWSSENQDSWSSYK